MGACRAGRRAAPRQLNAALACTPFRLPAGQGAEGRTFVRVLLLRGRVQGAVLIGETGAAWVLAGGMPGGATHRQCSCRPGHEPAGCASPRQVMHAQPAAPRLPADLDETLENLILDQLDVSAYGPDLLDPDAELDHVFD